MSYQNVQIPRFYINIPEWLFANKIVNIDPVLTTLPVLSVPNIMSGNIVVEGFMPASSATNFNFVAMLNCPSSSNFSVDGATLLPIINMDGDYNGFRIAIFQDSIASLNVTGSAGSIVIGRTYTMSNNPNLSLNMNREYSKIKEFTTYNGSSVSNMLWDRPAKWGNSAPWELFEHIEFEPQHPMGDLNQDYQLNVLDIVNLVNAALGGEWTDTVMEFGDMNQDGSLDVVDIVIIVNNILMQQYEDTEE